MMPWPSSTLPRKRVTPVFWIANHESSWSAAGVTWACGVAAAAAPVALGVPTATAVPPTFCRPLLGLLVGLARIEPLDVPDLLLPLSEQAARPKLTTRAPLPFKRSRRESFRVVITASVSFASLAVLRHHLRAPLHRAQDAQVRAAAA